jgi:hypothetical protein
MGCGATTLGFNSATLECACSTGKVLGIVCKSKINNAVETSGAGTYLTDKECYACPSTSYPSDTDPYTCIPCPDSRMVYTSGACTCSSGYSTVILYQLLLMFLVGRTMHLHRRFYYDKQSIPSRYCINYHCQTNQRWKQRYINSPSSITIVFYILLLCRW